MAKLSMSAALAFLSLLLFTWSCSQASCSYISTSELYDLGKQLWNADSKMRLRSGMDFVLDLQNTAYQGYDSTRPLFRSVNQTAIDKPTFRALRTLFDNYYREVGRAEYVSDQEVSENWKFLNTIVSTKTISIVYQFLKSKGRVTNFSDFKTKLYNMWFGLYSRKSSQSVRDSSGFEHIFVGETDWYKVSGFHNWLRLYLQEQSRKVDYEGYFTSTNSAHLKAFRFSWYNKPKTYGSFFLGTSPEFEVAIYSLTAFSGVRNPVFKLGNYRVEIRCYLLHSGTKISTCYPKLL